MLEIKNLRKVYEDASGKCVALDDISFSLPSKGMVFIVGKSGCGKTTLLNAIGGLDSFTSGEIFVNKKPLSKFSVNELDNYRNATVGFIFQDFCLIDRMNVINNIKMSLKVQNNKKKIDYNKLLEKFGLKGLGHRYPTQLSAGQKQRVSIARAIVKDPDIILADEPTGNVDEKTSEQVLEILKEISNERLVVIISHNLDEAQKFADRIIEMSDGKIISDKSINPTSTDKLIIKKDEIILPGNGIIDDEDVFNINKKIIERKGDVKIIQSQQRFIEKNHEIDHIEVPIKKVKMGFLSYFDFAGFFFKKKIVFNIFIILLITFVTSVFSICEILGFSNYDNEFNRVTQERNYIDVNPSYDKKTNILDKIDETSLDEIANKHDVDIDYIYNATIETYNSKSSLVVSAYYNPNRTNTDIFTNGYVKETTGVAVTSLDRLKKRFNNYEVVAGEIKQTGSGVIITDYIADCILKLNNENYKTYQDIVDGGYISNKLDVDAIIKTDFYERFPNFFENCLEYKKDESVKHNVMNTYSYCYSLNPNFKKDYYNDFKNSSKPKVIVPHNVFINSQGTNKGSNFGYYFDKNIAEDEIYMDYAYYNKYFNANYNQKNLDTFVMDFIQIELLNPNKEVILSKQFKITKLFVREHHYGNFYLSMSYYDQLFEPLFFAYSISVDTSKGHCYYFVEELYKIKDTKWEFSSHELHLMYSTLELFSTFYEVFKFVSYLLITAIFLIIILNSNTIIKQNVYEIGLMKAYGVKTKELVIIFTLQMILSSLFVCGLLYFSSKVFIDFADQLLKGGVLAYLNKTSNIYQYHYDAFVFSDAYFFFNILIISLSTIISVVVPILAIRRIKPLKIIKTRN